MSNEENYIEKQETDLRPVPQKVNFLDLCDACVGESDQPLHWVNVGKYKFALGKMSGSQKMAVTSLALKVDTGALMEAAGKGKNKSDQGNSFAAQMALDKMLVEKMFFMIKDWNVREIIRTKSGEPLRDNEGQIKTRKKEINRTNIADLKEYIFDELREAITAFEENQVGEEQIKNSKEG